MSTLCRLWERQLAGGAAATGGDPLGHSGSAGKTPDLRQRTSRTAGARHWAKSLFHPPRN